MATDAAAAECAVETFDIKPIGGAREDLLAILHG